MLTLNEELLSRIKESSSDNYDGGGSISSFDVLSFRELDELE